MPKNPSFQDVNDLFNRFHGEIEALIMDMLGDKVSYNLLNCVLKILMKRRRTSTTSSQRFTERTVRTMAKTIVTQFGEFLNYDNLVRIGIITNWEDAEVDEESGTITPDYEMIGTDTAGNQIPMGIYATPDEAEAVLKDLHDWLSMEAYAVYEVKSGGDA